MDKNIKAILSAINTNATALSRTNGVKSVRIYLDIIQSLSWKLEAELKENEGKNAE